MDIKRYLLKIKMDKEEIVSKASFTDHFMRDERLSINKGIINFSPSKIITSPCLLKYKNTTKR